MPRRTVSERLWSRVDRSDADGCWLWQGATTSRGYGHINVDGRMRSVHRLAYEELVSPIAAGLTIDHLCFTKLCVNPSHLEPVTAAENVRRERRTRPRRTHCPAGHERTLLASNGGCLLCKREVNRRWRAANRDRMNEAQRARRRRAKMS